MLLSFVFKKKGDRGIHVHICPCMCIKYLWKDTQGCEDGYHWGGEIKETSFKTSVFKIMRYLLYLFTFPSFFLRYKAYLKPSSILIFFPLPRGKHYSSVSCYLSPEYFETYYISLYVWYILHVCIHVYVCINNISHCFAC